ncbi:hypothetical protein M3Y99_00179700 [Aphelenchoides fujianensis]|nr:hypothetical protein M3Y99_00179700 [Aphelenchoides fujianensis]
MSLAILRAGAMSSADCSMGLRSFLVHDEPLNAGRLKLADGRLYEELEIKSLMRDHSPLMSNGAAAQPPSGRKIPAHNYCTSDCSSTNVDATSSSASSSCSTGAVRRSNGTQVPPVARKPPSRTPSTASTSLSSNGTKGNSSTTFRTGASAEKGHVEYTEPTVLIASHRPLPIAENGTRRSNPVVSVERRDSNASADAEVSDALRRSRTQSGEGGMPDEEELLGRAELSDEMERMGLNGEEDPTAHLPAQRRTELQVTDNAGFPLLDVWQKSSCFQTTWIVECFGRIVLMLHDCGRPWKLWTAARGRSSGLEVEDADGELLGYFVVAEPFVIQNRERRPIAHFNSYDGGDGRSILFQCVAESNGEENRKSQLSQLRFGQSISEFKLKILVLAAAVRIAAMPQNQSADCGNSTPRSHRPKRRNKASCCSIV